MDMDGFDPSSLLDFAMEENDGVVKNNVNFEDPGCTVNQNRLDNDHIINLKPDNSDPQILTSNKNVSDQIISDVDPGNSDIRDVDLNHDNSVSGHENNTATISSKQNLGPIVTEELGIESMCSVPISMFHMFHLDDHFDTLEGQDNLPVKESVPKKLDTFIKKLLPIVHSEKTYRKNLFKNSPDTIKLFKLHCTVCNKHIGLSPIGVERILRVHRDLNVIMCRNCFDFYGNGNFPVEEGSEIYCEWCGQGGTIFCCSNCPKVFCESCIIKNFGIDRRNQIEAISTWSCFACNPSELWPHRAICWALQRHIRESRAKLPLLEKEERETFLNKDISECCLKSGVVSTIPLPPQPQLQKVPICLFANKHSKMIKTSLKNIRLSEVRNNQTVFLKKDKLIKQKPKTIPVSSKQNIIPHVPLVQQQPFIPQVQPTINSGTQPITPNHLQQALQGFGRPTISNYAPPPVEVINLEDENEARATMLQTPLPGHINVDLSWLQTAVKESSHCLFEFQSLLNQFDLLSGKLRTDINQVNEFTNKLHSLFKITISSLAKIDYNMLQNLKNCTTPTVRNYSSITITKKPEAQQLVAQQLVAETPRKPQTTILPPSHFVRLPVTSSTVHVPLPVPVVGSEPSEEADLNCLLFCETVMTEAGDGNKENEFNVNNNFIQKDTRLNTVPVPRSVNRMNNSRKRPVNTTKRQTTPIIVLDDDEPPSKKLSLTKVQYKFYYKKFNLKPCKVLLSRCDELL